jgi:NDP-sugar pyrophosphorylase family protein
MEKEIALVYMLGGLSSRFNGGIKCLERVGLNNESLLEVSLKQALSSGFSKIIFIVGEGNFEQIKSLFGDSYQEMPIKYVLQDFDSNKRDKPWGTVDALCCLKEVVDCPFVVCNGDTLYGEEPFRRLVEHLENYDYEAMVGYKLKDVLPETGKVNKGILYLDENYFVKELKEFFGIERNDLYKSDELLRGMCSKNLLAFFPNTLESLCKRSENFKRDNKDNRFVECILSEELSALIKGGLIKIKCYPTNSPCYDITNPGDEIIIREELRKSEEYKY